MELRPTRRSRSFSQAGELAPAAHAANHARGEHRTAGRRIRCAPGKTASCAAGTGAAAGLEIAPLLSRRVIARDAEHAHAIAAVRRGVHLEHGIVEIQRRAHIPVRAASDARQFHDAVVLLAEPELARGAQHAVRLQAAQLRALDRARRRAARAPTVATATFSPSRTFGAPQMICSRSLAVGRRPGTPTTCPPRDGARTRAPRRPRRPRTAAPPAASDSTSSPASVSCLRELGGRRGERRELLHPGIGDLHGNCFRNCRSFSKNRRRSSTP